MNRQIEEALLFLASHGFKVKGSGDRIFVYGLANDANAFIWFLEPDRTIYHKLASKTEVRVRTSVKTQPLPWIKSRNADLYILFTERLKDAGWFSFIPRKT